MLVSITYVCQPKPGTCEAGVILSGELLLSKSEGQTHTKMSQRLELVPIFGRYCYQLHKATMSRAQTVFNKANFSHTVLTNCEKSGCGETPA